MHPRFQLMERINRQLEHPSEYKKKTETPRPTRKRWDEVDWFIFFIFSAVAIVALGLIATLGK